MKFCLIYTEKLSDFQKSMIHNYVTIANHEDEQEDSNFEEHAMI